MEEAAFGPELNTFPVGRAAPSTNSHEFIISQEVITEVSKDACHLYKEVVVISFSRVKHIVKKCML